ncbi:EAL domain-containing protein [Simiduia sp. 21SJ11W-1]|uniref:putative bifunctional diguanylate cyclase/phosphodiesterase n=1 Tax=Simiduia sp. 21SJ11W-1 TaxID=2909669 RepID=UPI0020A038FF|nr:EAL domain-containing protein [Simiduia sp. 21SJ11W-1]UTA47255.1 EAL domain-containing protein [Simiduia sp. 21SJ11W-1]
MPSLLPNASQQHLQRRAQRLSHVIYWCMGGFITAMGLNLWVGVNWYTQAIFALTLIALSQALRAISGQQVERASTILLWGITLCLSAVIAANFGLLDKGVLGFPALLIFAALFSKPRQFWILFSFILAVVTLLGIAQLSGWKPRITMNVTLSTLANTFTILAITGFSVHFLARDLRLTLNQLAEENEKFRASEAKATYLAQYDALTGLPNRTLCEDRFTTSLLRIKRHGGQCALLFIDLDNFKTINDSLGHSIGDKVLQMVAKTLKRSLRETDTACRFGGDEFIVLLNDVKNARQVERVAAKILKMLTKPAQLDNHYIQTSASIGIAMAPQDGSDFESFCKNADIAMYRAKADGKNLYRFFDAGMNTLSDERFVLIKDLRKAVKNDELRLYYQPKVDLRTGKLVGAEALIRWQHPERGLMTPVDFIELAEETGLIVEIGNWVLREACRQCKQWHLAGHSNLEIAVNLSPVQFTRGTLEKEVVRALSEAALEGQHLELELTESLLLSDAENVRAQIADLRLHGVSFSIDDFGTGYSNLGYLSKFDLEALKIDQSFVRKMLDSKQDLNIIIAIINIAQSLGLATVAEGVEDALALARLQELGCDLGQGYFWSKPLACDEFEQLMSEFS